MPVSLAVQVSTSMVSNIMSLQIAIVTGSQCRLMVESAHGVG